MRVVVVLVLALLVGGCGGAEPELPAPLDASTLAGLESRDRDLAEDALAADSFDPEELAGVLAAGGYAGGRERELTGHTDTFDHVIARTLRFDRPDGADAYLDWVAAHTLDLVGRTRPRAPFAVGERALLFELEPCSTCKKQLPTLVAAWRRGGSVGYLLTSGRDVDRASVRRLVEAVDRSLDPA